MMSASERWSRIAAGARQLWATHQRTLLYLSVALLSVIAALRLPRAFADLLWSPVFGHAIDAKIPHLLVRRWFASIPVYNDLSFAVHPPATYAMLWPFFGWLDLTAARWLWALTSVAALAWLIYLTLRESGADSAMERGLVAILPLSMYATAHTVRAGQLILHLLPALLAGLLLLRRARPGWGLDLLAAALVLVTLVKPTVSLPFLWLVPILSGRLRPAVLIAAGYAALTLFAASFQELGTAALFQQWRARGSALAASEGTANLHLLLAALGLERWILPASLLVFVGLGLWIYRHRYADFWILLAVTALVARFWTYHRPTDDVMLLLPEIALFRMAKGGSSSEGTDIAAAALLAITAVGMLAPIGLIFSHPPWGSLVTAGNAVIWIVVLVFLIRQAGMAAERSGDPKLRPQTPG